MIAVTSDWHWADGGGNDKANYEGAIHLIDFAFQLPIDAFVLAGDWHDFWKCGFKAVIRYNEARYRYLALRSRETRIPIVRVRGNHDSVSDRTLLEALRPYGLTFVPGDDGVQLAGWYICHGHRWDVFNRGFPLSPIAHVLTRAVGLIQEHVWEGLDESKLNPMSWISAARKGHDPVRAAATAWTKDALINVCFGHTHRRFIEQGPGWKVVNCGCAVEGREASLALLDVAGTANLFHSGALEAAHV
jgi:DNA repair exonuclease SbcCD nuclease subunit